LVRSQLKADLKSDGRARLKRTLEKHKEEIRCNKLKRIHPRKKRAERFCISHKNF